MGLQRVVHDWATKHSTAYAEHCRWGIPCSFRTSFSSAVSWTRVPSMPRGLPAISISSCLPVMQSMFQDSGCGESEMSFFGSLPHGLGSHVSPTSSHFPWEKLQDEISPGPELTKSQTRLSNWTEVRFTLQSFYFACFFISGMIILDHFFCDN